MLGSSFLGTAQNAVDSILQKIHSKPIHFSSFEELYIPISETKQLDKLYKKIEAKLDSEKEKLVNELAYIHTCIWRSTTSKSFILLREIRPRILQQDDYIKGLYYLVSWRLTYFAEKIDLADKYSKRAIFYLKKAQKYEELKLAYICRAFHLSSYNREKAIQIMQKAYDLEKKGVFKYGVVLRTNMAFINIKTNINDAIRYCEDGMEVLKREPYNFMDEYRVNIILASIYYEKEDMKMSNKYLLEAKRIGKLYKMNHLVKEIDKSMSYRYAMKNDFVSAYYSLRESDSVSQVVALDKLSETLAVYDLEDKIKAEKREKKRIRELAVIRQEENRILLIFLFLILGALLFISVLWFQIRAKNKVLVAQNMRLAQTDTQRVKQENSEVKDVSIELIIELEKLIYDKKIYEKQTLTIDKLAKKLNTNRTYLSEAINTHYKTNYSAWINEIRVDAARKLLASSEYDHYSIDGIAKMVGYASISAFNASFKKFTGLTPSQFKKSREEVLLGIDL